MGQGCRLGGVGAEVVGRGEGRDGLVGGGMEGWGGVVERLGGLESICMTSLECGGHCCFGMVLVVRQYLLVLCCPRMRKRLRFHGIGVAKLSCLSCGGTFPYVLQISRQTHHPSYRAAMLILHYKLCCFDHLPKSRTQHPRLLQATISKSLALITTALFSVPGSLHTSRSSASTCDDTRSCATATSHKASSARSTPARAVLPAIMQKPSKVRELPSSLAQVLTSKATPPPAKAPLNTLTNVLSRCALEERKQKGASPQDVRLATREFKYVTRALANVWKHKDDVQARKEIYDPVATYDLDDLEKVAEDYYAVCTTYEQHEDHYLLSVANEIKISENSVVDKATVPFARLKENLNVFDLNFEGGFVPVLRSLRLVQLFNIEKKFGFIEESYEALKNEDDKWHQRPACRYWPMSLRQKWNDPVKLMEAPPKKEKESKKLLRAKDALDQIRHNCKLATEEIMNIRKTVPKNKAHLLGVPSRFSYHNVPIPTNIPKDIRQRLFDLEFAYEEFVAMREAVYEMRDHVRATFIFWYSTSKEVWEYGKTRIHELADMRKYEYHRIALEALCYVASREEMKIMEFFMSKKGASYLSLAIAKAFKIESRTLADLEKEWTDRIDMLRHGCESVHVMLAHVDKNMETMVEGNHSKTDWWQWLVPGQN